MSDDPVPREAPLGQILVSANCSLTPSGALLFFAGVATGSLALAGSLAILGYWPVLPLAGLELAALGAGLGSSQKRGRYRERISVYSRRVVIEKGTPGEVELTELPRAPIHVSLARSSVRGHPSRLFVGSQDRRCEVGCTLTEEERERLGARLRRLVAGGPAERVAGGNAVRSSE